MFLFEKEREQKFWWLARVRTEQKLKQYACSFITAVNCNRSVCLVCIYFWTDLIRYLNCDLGCVTSLNRSFFPRSIFSLRFFRVGFRISIDSSGVRTPSQQRLKIQDEPEILEVEFITLLVTLTISFIICASMTYLLVWVSSIYQHTNFPESGPVQAHSQSTETDI